MTSHSNCLLLSATLILLISTTAAVAQTLPSTRPTTRAAPAKVTTPRGFVRVDLDSRSFLTLPSDEAWVRRAAGQIARPTPATQTSDMIANLKSRREIIVADVMRDLPAIIPSRVEKALDDLAPLLARIETVRPAMVYVVAPAEHVKQALRDGWTDPRFRYNAPTDSIEYDRSVSLQPDGGSDESAVAAFFNPGDAESKRTTALSRYVADTEQQIRQQVTTSAVAVVVDRFRSLVATEALSDLPKREDQDWLLTGLSNVLAARYAAKLHGAPMAELIQVMLMAPPNAVFNAARIDLVRPLASDQLKDEMVAPYLEAKRRKSIAVVFIWLDRAGANKVATLIEAVSRLRPADGPSLVDVVKSATGVDLSNELSPD